MALFSKSGLRALINSYAPEKGASEGGLDTHARHEMQRVLDVLAAQTKQTLAKNCFTEQKRTFFLCVGAPGSGNTDFILAQAETANMVPVLTEDLRAGLVQTLNAEELCKYTEYSAKDTQTQANQYVEPARIYVARQIVNMLDEEGLYHIAYPCQPESMMRGNLVDELSKMPDLHIKLFCSPLTQMSAATNNQSANPEHIVNGYMAMPNVIKRSLAQQAQSVEIYWRDEATAQPILAVRATPDSGFNIINQTAFAAFVKDMHEQMGERRMTAQRLKDLYAQSHETRAPQAKPAP